jgi:Ankyrin repeats (3 copies)
MNSEASPPRSHGAVMSHHRHHHLHSTQSGSTTDSTSPRKKRDLPPLFWYMEMGDWEKATARAKGHPKEVKTRATLRTKSMSEDGTKVTGTKRLALHHACFKLRSAAAIPIPLSSRMAIGSISTRGSSHTCSDEDPFIAVCKFILLLLEVYPEACQVRESRHGCLPLHLAAFASCYVRPQGSNDNETITQSISSVSTHSTLTRLPSIASSGYIDQTNTARSQSLGVLEKPNIMSVRSMSDSTSSTSNMTAVLMEENFAGTQTERKKQGGLAPQPMTPCNVPLSAALQEEQATGNTTSNQQLHDDANRTIFISNKREQMAVNVLNAMLDAYPRAIRLDSEGGRLPLHTACAGRSTPRCVSLLLQAYPAAARHRNKDGFLPLHLAAHWGVSHPNVAITLLKAYPDATVGRNRWERTPLEEALVMAGENGRPHQAPLVRALRKHPSYWTRPPIFESTSNFDRQRTGSNLVDIDVTLASNDDETSTDHNPRYFNAGHDSLLSEYVL